MRRSAFASAVAAVLAVGIGCEPQGGSGSQVPGAAPANAPEPIAAPAEANLNREELAVQIKRHFESSGQIPSDVAMELVDISDSQIDGLKKGTLRLSREDQSQDLEFLLSADGRWFLRADPVDLTIDPVTEVLEKIKIGTDDPFLGPADASVTIVEYSDFQCPFCARAEEIVQQEVLKEYGDRVKFVYKQFPLVSIHPWAQPASEIGICVLRQNGNDAYWKYHAAVFGKQQEVQADTAVDQLVEIAKESGADPAKVKACYDADETAPVIVATLEEAEAIGVNSTPTFFVNGRRLSGAQPLEAFKEIIEPELAKKQG
ncbi:MAG: DsbA family protein [Deltaproteobacteria bacterium]|nr:DsbA family protein [Deltaproteobacteria bacterium]